MKKLLSLFLLSGCVSVGEVDVTKYEPACARECTGRHSSCIAGSGYVNALQQQSCKEGLGLCLKTCPAK